MTAARAMPLDGAPPSGPAEGATRIEAGALLRRAADEGTARAGPHLVVREPGSSERVVAVTGDFTVGRGREVALRLADPSTSRVHLRLRVGEAGTAVEDLGSRNGLRINGGRARGLRRLRSGDELEVGETLLRYVDPLQPIDAAGEHSWAARTRPSAVALLALAAALLAGSALALAWP
jgi:pSer/pThr/pTyr-binding forkhead associated (FHA) protein